MTSEFTIAVHCLVLLSMKQKEMATSDCLAASVSTHPARVRKVLSLLRKQGYVTTREGASGGYQLAIAEDELTLGDLYHLLSEGSLKPNWCSGQKNSPCEVGSNMTDVMEQIYCGGESVLRDYFSRITLQDVREQIEARSSRRDFLHLGGDAE
ncbi:Rrf2 family transcriptional regulator [Paenibacillus sp. JX-17]|uniref:Rrf2 family transcriptional regulator n=1 Tax=Paenibacillus lacisoli TaxID=3064525 RepID=A0ABT9CFL2_9BACL|nr:Rrf2 family transcriptional regulator [Paenibacillus sp. JX-17]MDO7906732.1 Rrf2 family transcriptional regulator [Paenibacillus sp. JX-17]